MPRLTGGQAVMERLVAERVPYFIGIPGHGCIAMLDAALGYGDRLKVIQVRHEQSAIHMADGYYRVAGRPLACFTSIGPGALNTAVGLGTAYVDSTAVLLLSGETHTHMSGRGVLQEVERRRAADLPSALAPLVKKSHRPASVQELASALEDAFVQMRTGRPGPVFISVPMDVQADAADIPAALGTSVPAGRRPAAVQVRQAAALLIGARRPVIVAGGGVTNAGAETELRRVAEILGAAVVTTLQGKGCFPEDHALYGWHPGTKGTSVGNALTSSADVVLAVGTRITDQVSSSFRQGVTFRIPPTKLIHIDVDRREIGKNYPTEVGIVADAAAALSAIAAECERLSGPERGRGAAYSAEIRRLREAWQRETAPLRDSSLVPPTVPRFFRELRSELPKDAIVVTSSGHAQACMLEVPFYLPRTNITTGGFSTMGFAYPAALGAKLAAPGQDVVAVIGDGDFMMTMQEMATAKQYGIPAVVVVLNNAGWYSIRDLQKAEFGEDRELATVFATPDGTEYSPDFTAAAKAFGLRAESVGRPEQVGPAVRRALDSGQPSLVEVQVQRKFGYSGSNVVGWWDVPVPTYLVERRARYEAAKAEEAPRPAESRGTRVRRAGRGGVRG